MYAGSGSGNYSAHLSYNSLQLGNNSINYLVAGRTTAGGVLELWTNNTANVYRGNAPDGFRNARFENGRTDFYGSLYLNGSPVGGGGAPATIGASTTVYYKSATPLPGATAVTWQGANNNSGNFWSSGNPTVLLPKWQGRYLIVITGYVQWAATTVFDYSFYIKVAGGIFGASATSRGTVPVMPSGDETAPFNMSWILDVTSDPTGWPITFECIASSANWTDIQMSMTFLGTGTG
jgi:hypothetical protein